MKRIIVLVLAIAPVCAIAAAPSTSCPSGYTTSAGTATSCIASNPGGSCIMYAPVGVSYTDATGTYEYTEACAME